MMTRIAAVLPAEVIISSASSQHIVLNLLHITDSSNILHPMLLLLQDFTRILTQSRLMVTIKAGHIMMMISTMFRQTDIEMLRNSNSLQISQVLSLTNPIHY